MITGDLVINQPYDVSKIDQDLIDLFKQSELNIINLEAPVTSSVNKIMKTGPHLVSHENSTLNVLKALNINVVTLANNHVLDYGEKGVKDTLSFCQENDFKSVGAGINLKESSKTLFLSTQQGKIALVNFAENEWSSATEENAGANPMDIIDNAKQIKEAKEKSDFVFVIVHGGHEYYNLPSPRMQKQYRFYAEQGADIVIGHHTHCISGYEYHNGVPIYYSLGNFLFTNQSTYEDWYIGLVLQVEIKSGQVSTQLHPVIQEKGSFKLSLLKLSEKQKILNRISKYNSFLTDPMKLKYEWDKFIESQYQSYLEYWSPLSFINNRYVKGILRRSGINLTNTKGIALALNLMRCEAHWDISKEVNRKYLRKMKK